MKVKYEEYVNSPYKIEGVVEKIYTSKDNDTLTVNPETGEFYTLRKLGKDTKFLHDGVVYTKLFQESIHRLMTLPHPAFKIIIYAMSVVKPLSETVVLNGPDVCLYCGIASSTFYNNIYELLDRKILSRKLGSSIEFWFDPNIFFNGNRVKMVK